MLGSELEVQALGAEVPSAYPLCSKVGYAEVPLRLSSKSFLEPLGLTQKNSNII